MHRARVWRRTVTVVVEASFHRTWRLDDAVSAVSYDLQTETYYSDVNYGCRGNKPKIQRTELNQNDILL